MVLKIGSKITLPTEHFNRKFKLFVHIPHLIF